MLSLFQIKSLKRADLIQLFKYSSELFTRRFSSFSFDNLNKFYMNGMNVYTQSILTSLNASLYHEENLQLYLQKSNLSDLVNKFFSSEECHIM